MKFKFLILSLFFSLSAFAQHVGGNSSPMASFCDSVLEFSAATEGSFAVARFTYHVGDYTISTDNDGTFAASALLNAQGSGQSVCVKVQGSTVIGVSAY